MPLITPRLLRSSLVDILTAVRARLADQTNVPLTAIRRIARPTKKTPKFMGDQDILLRFAGFRADFVNHRGRHDCRVRHALQVTIRTRVELDEADSDDLWLGHATLGNIVFWEDVVDALQEWFPEDAQHNHLGIVEGLFVMECDEGQKDGGDKAWGEARLTFGVVAELPLDQSR